MKHETGFIVVGGVEVPESAVLRREPVDRYGGVPGLGQEDLADPDELERQVIRQEFGPVLALPVKSKGSWVQPACDESGGVDWGAFGSIDFQRLVPEFDKARYKADKLREELKDALIMLSIVRERVPGSAKYQVLKHLRMGVLDLDHVTDHDMHALGKWYLRARRIRDEIRQLEKASEARQRRQAQV